MTQDLKDRRLIGESTRKIKAPKLNPVLGPGRKARKIHKVTLGSNKK